MADRARRLWCNAHSKNSRLRERGTILTGYSDIIAIKLALLA